MKSLCALILVLVCVQAADVFRAKRRYSSSSQWEVQVTGADGVTRTYKGTGEMPDMSTFTGGAGAGMQGLNNNGGGAGGASNQLKGGKASVDFVNRHNTARQGERVGLGNVKWDTELVAYAEQNVAKCKMVHDNSGQKTSQFSYIGQNLFWTSQKGIGPAEAAKQAVASWMSEKQYYTLSTNSCSDVCGHYTQVVWKSSTSIGCAVSTDCGDGTYVACNYGPGGNWMGQKPY